MTLVGVVSYLMFLIVFSFLDWTGLDEDEDAHVWEDNWDDDNVEDDFSNQLRYFGPVCNFLGLAVYCRSYVAFTGLISQLRFTNKSRTAKTVASSLG